MCDYLDWLRFTYALVVRGYLAPFSFANFYFSSLSRRAYVADGLYYMAKLIEKYIDFIIRENPEAFREVPFIGTNLKRF